MLPFGPFFSPPKEEITFSKTLACREGTKSLPSDDSRELHEGRDHIHHVHHCAPCVCLARNGQLTNICSRSQPLTLCTRSTRRVHLSATGPLHTFLPLPQTPCPTASSCTPSWPGYSNPSFQISAQASPRTPLGASLLRNYTLTAAVVSTALVYF